MRLIDADELKGKAFADPDDGEYFVYCQDIDEAPTVDAVPVIRCRDCKHWHEDIGWCDIHSHFQYSDGEFCHPWESSDWKMFPADYFCADGKRRGVE